MCLLYHRREQEDPLEDGPRISLEKTSPHCKGTRYTVRKKIEVDEAHNGLDCYLFFRKDEFLQTIGPTPTLVELTL
jgi:hypothetical protein